MQTEEILALPVELFVPLPIRSRQVVSQRGRRLSLLYISGRGVVGGRGVRVGRQRSTPDIPWGVGAEKLLFAAGAAVDVT